MPSSNDRARELALAGAPHGTLVTASEQTAGRGRQGRRWEAPAGSALLLSLVLRGEAGACVDSAAQSGHGSPLPSGHPPRPSGHAQLRSGHAPLPLLAAVAVCDAIGKQARIKWPNDVLLPRQGDAGMTKVAGILAEGRPQEGWAVLGIGVNVAVRVDELPEELHATAGTLGLAKDAIAPTLARLLRALERRLNDPAEQTLDAWRERDALRGRKIFWTESGGEQRRTCEGHAEGIDDAGRLLVALAGGERTALEAGEVHLR